MSRAADAMIRSPQSKMRTCCSGFLLLGATLAILGAARPSSAQDPLPRTAWGAPDLRGLWNHGTATPLERPERHAGQDQLTDNEIAAVNAEARSTEGVGTRRAVWWERSLSDGRTSMITSPAGGRIPYTADARRRVRALPPPAVDTPEDRGPQERCISYGIPRLGGPYSQNVYLAQTPDHVLLLFEMVHEFRVIPLDGRPRLAAGVGQWLGDSRGRWDGDTLVIETTNFSAHQLFRRLPMAAARLVERLTRIDADTLHYDVTFEDPSIWTEPWTAAIEMARTEGPMFEFACHEGNVGMTAILEIGRTEELKQEER
jgi:hypothetical protein